jgi:rRNA-processing protein FCF1
MAKVLIDTDVIIEIMRGNQDVIENVNLMRDIKVLK